MESDLFWTNLDHTVFVWVYVRVCVSVRIGPRCMWVRVWVSEFERKREREEERFFVQNFLSCEKKIGGRSPSSSSLSSSSTLPASSLPDSFPSKQALKFSSVWFVHRFECTAAEEFMLTLVCHGGSGGRFLFPSRYQVFPLTFELIQAT